MLAALTVLIDKVTNPKALKVFMCRVMKKKSRWIRKAHLPFSVNHYPALDWMDWMKMLNYFLVIDVKLISNLFA